MFYYVKDKWDGLTRDEKFVAAIFGISAVGLALGFGRLIYDVGYIKGNTDLATMMECLPEGANILLDMAV